LVQKNNLTPQLLLNTHCHLDHIWGNHWTATTFGLTPRFHTLEYPLWQNAPKICMMYGVPPFPAGPEPQSWIEEGDCIAIGTLEVTCLFLPGHSPGSIGFYCEEEGWLIGGDVLFKDSIGRTDLPGGDMDTLLQSIRQKLWPLPDSTVVYSGHGPDTTIGIEKKFNPFLTGALP
jgi:glyoxylase-like metal-dependent hydrolase (beta-lactamase superfamily II)